MVAEASGADPRQPDQHLRVGVPLLHQVQLCRGDDKMNKHSPAAKTRMKKRRRLLSEEASRASGFREQELPPPRSFERLRVRDELPGPRSFERDDPKDKPDTRDGARRSEYPRWRKRVALWLEDTRCLEEKRGIRLMRALSDRAWELVEDVDWTPFKGRGGDTRLLTYLGRVHADGGPAEEVRRRLLRAVQGERGHDAVLQRVHVARHEAGEQARGIELPSLSTRDSVSHAGRAERLPPHQEEHARQVGASAADDADGHELERKDGHPGASRQF